MPSDNNTFNMNRTITNMTPDEIEEMKAFDALPTKERLSRMASGDVPSFMKKKPDPTATPSSGVQLRARDTSPDQKYQKAADILKKTKGVDLSNALTSSVRSPENQDVIRSKPNKNPVGSPQGGRHTYGEGFDTKTKAQAELLENTGALKKAGLTRPLKQTDPNHITSITHNPNAQMDLGFTNINVPRITNPADLRKTGDIVKSKFNRFGNNPEPQVAEKPAEPGFWDKFKNSSAKLGRGAAQTDVNPPETFKKDIAAVNKTPPSGQAFRPDVMKRPNSSTYDTVAGFLKQPVKIGTTNPLSKEWWDKSDNTAVASEPPKSSITETPAVNEDIPPMNEKYENKNVSLNGTADKRGMSLSAKAEIPPMGSDVPSNLTPGRDPNKATSPYVPPMITKDLGDGKTAIEAHSGDNQVNSTDNKPAIAALENKAAYDKEVTDQQYGANYNKYIADMDAQKKVSRDALAGKYNQYLAQLDRNQQAEFWQGIIHSLGKVVAGGMNYAMNQGTKNSDGSTTYDSPIDVAGNYKPVDVFNRETADKRAESRFKAEEALNNTALQDAMTKLEAVRKGTEARDMALPKAQSDKNANFAKLPPTTTSDKQGTNQTVTQPSYSNPTNKPGRELISDVEAQKTAAAATKSLNDMKLLPKVNSGSVRNKEDFMKKVSDSSHYNNLDRMYDVVAARSKGLTPAQLAAQAVADYGTILSTNDEKTANELGINLKLTLRPKMEEPVGRAPQQRAAAPAPTGKVKWAGYKQSETYINADAENKKIMDATYVE